MRAVSTEIGDEQSGSDGKAGKLAESSRSESVSRVVEGRERGAVSLKEEQEGPDHRWTGIFLAADYHRPSLVFVPFPLLGLYACESHVRKTYVPGLLLAAMLFLDGRSEKTTRNRAILILRTDLFWVASSQRTRL